jgi:phenylacetate-CoA ligase
MKHEIVKMEQPWSDFDPIWKAACAQAEFWKCCGAPREINSYEDFVCIPELKKADLRNRIDDLICKDVEATSFISTGGSTGEPLKLPVGADNAPRVRRQQAKGRSAYDIQYKERCFLIWGHSSGMGSGLRAAFERLKRKLKDRVIGYYRLSAYELGNETLCAEFPNFLKFKPRWVCGYSSAVVAFARANWEKRERVHALKIKVVLCSAEMLRPSEAKELHEFFGAPVALEYGAMEFGPVAYTHPEREGLYVMDDLLVEAIPTEETHVFRLLVTSLYPRAVPMIRYDIGDQVKIYDPNFKGGIIQRFDEILGRQNDIITFPDGTAAHSEVVTHAIKAQDVVLSFQFHKWEDAMQLKLVVRADSNEAAVARHIREALISVNSCFSDTEIVFVEDVDVTSSGKRRWVVVHSESKK